MKSLIAILPIFLMISCAKDQVTISPSNAHAYKEFSKVTSIGRPVSAHLVRVLDQREKSDEIGEARTGGSYAKTPVRLHEDLPTFLKKHLEKELSARGFSFESESQYKISVMIKDFWLKEILEKYQPEKAHCRVELDIELVAGANRFHTNVWSEVTSPGDLGDATDKLGDTMASCLNSVIEQFAQDKKLRRFIDENAKG